MAVELVYETHSITLDSERGVATGWLPGELSERGRALARELGDRRRSDRIACVFTSDLRRAVDTAAIAFAGSPIEIRQDARLRECNYGQLNGAPVIALAPRRRFVDRPYPHGESYRDCVERTRRLLADFATEFDNRRVLGSRTRRSAGRCAICSTANRSRTSSTRCSPGSRAGSTSCRHRDRDGHSATARRCTPFVQTWPPRTQRFLNQHCVKMRA